MSARRWRPKDRFRPVSDIGSRPIDLHDRRLAPFIEFDEGGWTIERQTDAAFEVKRGAMMDEWKRPVVRAYAFGSTNPLKVMPLMPPSSVSNASILAA